MTNRDTKHNTAERAHGPVKLGAARLDKLIEEVTGDCCNESGQLWGLYTMIEENLERPFRTQVLGVDVTVERVEAGNHGTPGRRAQLEIHQRGAGFSSASVNAFVAAGVRLSGDTTRPTMPDDVARCCLLTGPDPSGTVGPVGASVGNGVVSRP